MTVEVPMAVLVTVAATLLLASSSREPNATTATRDAVRAVDLLRLAPFVAAALADAIRKKPVLATTEVVLLTNSLKMVPNVATISSVPVVNVPAAISNAGP